jgi:DNA phosphorothioation-dependent restriction protein DptH
MRIGLDVEANQEVFWNPDPAGGSPNPHVLILGESGFGKTYTVSCLLAELAQREIPTIVLDYGQGFSPTSAPPGFAQLAKPVAIQASRDGVNVNPMQIFPSDIHGPLNVAQRVADTFARVYPQLGVQQHSILRQAVVDVFADAGIVPHDHASWSRPLPDFMALSHKLANYAANLGPPQRAVAASAASHISTIFVFNTFRRAGHALSWRDMLGSDGVTHIVELHGLEHTLERVVTEFLLWNLLGFAEALGPGRLRGFVVLDEAHKLSFAHASPVERLLREGRKFGIGVILASQQPEDFSSVAFANTATKIIFQVGDERSVISRQLYRKVRSHSFAQIFDIITKLPQGYAYVVTENVGRVVRVDSFDARGR